MKLALVSLVCFVGLSWQQRYAVRQYVYAPRDYLPFVGMPSPYGPFGVPNIYGSEELFVGDDRTVADRTNNFFAPLTQMFNSLNSPVTSFNLVVTAFATTTTTTTSTSTVVQTVACISSTYFMPGSTTSCSLRRRDAEAVDLLAIAEVLENIVPSKVESEHTSFPDEEMARSTAIESSLSTAGEVDDLNSQYRQARWLTMTTSTVTKTSTATAISTSFTFEQYSLVANPSVLKCLPSGYTVC